MLVEQQGEPHFSLIKDGMMIHRDSGFYQVSLACGPLHKKRYVNEKIEQELVDFKKEI